MIPGMSEATMLAYHDDPAIKAKYLGRVAAHRKADEIVQQYGYWRDGRGCAVGCTIHGDDHDRYEAELGVPAMLAHLQDAIFEGLPVDEARDFPGAFLDAIPVGADLSRVGWRFLHWLLTEELAGKWPAEVQAALDGAAAVVARRAEGESAEDVKVEAQAAGAAARATDAAARAAALEAARAALAAAREGSCRRQADALLAMLREAPVPAGSGS